MRRTILLLTVVALTALAFVNSALAAPGDPDDSFDGDGQVVTSTGSANGDPGSGLENDLVLQADGKIVAGGAGLARYNPNGSLDPSFDSDGKLFTGHRDGRGLAIQPNGKIVHLSTLFREASGNFSVEFQLTRYNPNGSRDTTFDGDGKLTTAVSPGFGRDYPNDVAIQPDGKIVVAGSAYDPNTGNGDFAVVRYNPNGALDRSFSGDGKLITDFESGSDGAQALTIQGDGRIILAGITSHDRDEDGFTTDDFALARYKSDGSLDPTFAEDGKLTTSLAAGRDGSIALALQSNGKVVAGGYVTVSTASNGEDINKFALARYNPNGSLDTNSDADPNTNFGTDGKVITSFGSLGDNLKDLTIQSDGRIVAAGTTRVARAGGENDGEFALARYNPDGSLDSSFNDDGKVSTAVGQLTGSGANQFGGATAVALQANGRIVAAGHNNHLCLVRYFGGVDATAPVTPTITNPPNNSYETDSTITLSGRAEAGTTVQVFEVLDGEPPTATPIGTQVVVNTSGVWSKTIGGIVDKTHTYTVKATDGNGNTSVASASRTVTVDTKSPTGTVIINDGNSSTFSQTVSLTPMATDPNPASGVSLVRYRNENTTNWTSWQTYSRDERSWRLSSGAGNKAVFVQYQDRAGNVSTPARDTIRYVP